MQRELLQQPVELPAFLHVERSEDLLLALYQTSRNLLVEPAPPGIEREARLPVVIATSEAYAEHSLAPYPKSRKRSTVPGGSSAKWRPGSKSGSRSRGA